MPVIVRTVCSFLPDLSQNIQSFLVLMTAITISTLPQRFRLIHLLSTYLILSRRTFSLTLTTMAFVHSSLRWFEASICIAAPRGLPSSSVEHSFRLRGAHWTLFCYANSSTPCQPNIQFLFIEPRFCLQLPSDSTSQWTPLLSANSSCCQAYSGLSPPSYRPCRAH
jgi:hypothetical protein